MKYFFLAQSNKAFLIIIDNVYMWTNKRDVLPVK